MKHIKDIKPLVQQVRQRIIDTMVERGITKVEFIPTREAYDKEHENDEDYSDLDWDELKSNTTPAVVCNSIKGENQQYDVLSIELVDEDTKSARFKLECSGDYSDETFYDYDLFYFSMLGVYQELEEYLGIDDGEPEYVWVFTATQVCDDHALDTITEVFPTEEAALKHMQEFVGGEDGELAFAEKRGWTIEANTPDYFQAYEEGYYNGNHTEAQINKFEVKH